MNRQVTVAGTGRAKIEPDVTVLKFELSSRRLDYNELVKRSDEKLAQMQDLVSRLGFDKTALKTTSFKIEPAYKQKKSGFNYEKVRSGFKYSQVLKLEFGLDMAKLAEIMAEVSKFKVTPKVEIGFTIKDKEALREQLLIDATKNALTQVKILTNASGVKLGKLLDISYSWSEIRFMSDSDYDFDAAYLGEGSVGNSFEDMTPSEISVSDDATFVWEID